MKLKTALFFVLVAVGLHIYLAIHYYGLSFGLLTSDSICNVSSKFNCDTITASNFSSVFGIPIAMYGAVTNSALAILIMIWILGWSEDIPRHGRYTLWLSGLVATTSLVMGFISMFIIRSYCLFCIGAYITSFLVAYFVYFAQESGVRSTTEYFIELFGHAKRYLIFLVMVPFFTFLAHKSYVKTKDATELEQAIKSSLADWNVSPLVDLSSTTPIMSKGDQNAKMTIDEFADFRCSHCLQANFGLKAFINSHTSVKFNFYAFPLDGSCNDAITGGGDGLSCYLAKNVFCAEKTAQQGWAIHDYIYSKQTQISSQGNIDFAKQELANAYNKFNISEEAQKICLENPDTDAFIRAQAKAGANAGVKGTPTLFINGKKLSRGHLLPILEAVYKSL
ncbi:MAG: hypothetical protein A2Z20_10565 [Bdellovibrionales bacterium RBG_16_40_8]|nr:MAG: hypothetical protein A2Z20_10565 [Bdellovibrionales bacterium RBG_16_40_8]